MPECPGCGVDLDAGVSRCPVCGAEFDEPPGGNLSTPDSDVPVAESASGGGFTGRIPGMKPGHTLRNLVFGGVYFVIGGVALLFALGVVLVLLLGGGGDVDGSAQQEALTATPTAEPIPRHDMNEPFVVGSGAKRVEYTVTNATTTERVGGSFGETADGVFVVVALEITNVGDESFDLSSNVFHLVDSQGREYDTDTEAVIRAENGLSYEQVNPDLTITGVVIFDVPSDQTGRQLRVDPAGIFSGAESHYVRLSV